MSLRTWNIFISGLVALAHCFFACPRARAADVSEASTWYDTLGFPDVRDLPYVRVATGSFIIIGKQPPKNRFVEGFLAGEEPGAFTVFLCSVSDFQDRFEDNEPYTPLVVKRFVRKSDGPAHQRVEYEVLDFQKIAADVLARVRDIAEGPEDFQARQHLYADRYPGLRAPYNLEWGRHLSHRARIFAFARACQQKGLVDTASALFDISANIPDEQTGKRNPAKLRDALQQQIGEAVWVRAEESFGNPAISLEELLKTYQPFAARFPASSRVAYTEEATRLLRQMITEEAAHHPKPLEEMTPAEQVAENIYQLRHVGSGLWVQRPRYPFMAYQDRKETITPVHRLFDLGNVAVPQLITALDDRHFTRSMEERFNGFAEPHVMRVSDFAQRILEHMSGRSFYAGKSSDGKPAKATTRQQAEAWWKEVQSKGEKQSLVEAACAGGSAGLMAARTLAEKFPEDALPAIEAGIRASREDGYRGEYVEVAGKLPGDLSLAFLLAQLTPDHGVYSQSYAAEALLARGQSVAAVPAMIAAWGRIQARLPRNEGDAFSEVGRIISFLARSGDARAIDALERDMPAAPVHVRLAVVEVFQKTSFNGGGIGPMVSLREHVEKLPGGEAKAAIERLLVAALDDKERCFGPERNYPKASFKDPRVCDAAAFVLVTWWPERYSLQWPARPAECDLQIAKMRDRWRAEHGLPPGPSPAPPTSIAPATEPEVAPLLEAFTAASDDAARAAATEKIAETFGLRALPLVRAKLEKPGNAALRLLAIHLASLVREVRIEADASGLAGKSGVATLRGQRLNGERLDQLAHELESGMPEDVAAVTFVAERAGDGAGFDVTIRWLPGTVNLHAGWNREMAVRTGDQTVYRDSGWTAEHAMPQDAIFRKMAAEFEKAIQAEIDAPVFVRFRLQRGRTQ
jgi:hypothetical protein